MTSLAPRRRPRDRREQIEEAAAEMFAEHGQAGIGVNEIAKRVGITGGAIYRHFASKDELLETVIAGTLQDFCDAAEKANAAPAAEQVPELVRGAAHLTLSRAARAATYLREGRRTAGAVRERLREGERRLFDSWKMIIARANPDLGLDEITIRQRAVHGAILALALRQTEAPRSDLEPLFVGALSAVLLAGPMPPRLPSDVVQASWSPPQSRRQLILRAAASLFRRHGYRGVAVDQIGEAVGIAGPTVYGAYASKADILVDAHDYIAAKIQAGTDQALSEATSAHDALERLARSYVRVAFDNPDLLAVASRDNQALPEPDRARIGRRRSDHVSLWADVLRELRPDLHELQAQTLVLSSFAMIQQITLGPAASAPSVDATAALAVTFLTAPAADYAPDETIQQDIAEDAQ
jgi:AcrR family transcriptional regulator